MNAKEKEKQIMARKEQAGFDAPDDSESMITPSEVIVLGKRKYTIKPLTLRYMKMFESLARGAGNNLFNQEDYDMTLQVVSKAIGEEDVDFIEENITVPELQKVLAITARLSMHGMPNPQGGAKKGGAHGGRA